MINQSFICKFKVVLLGEDYELDMMTRVWPPASVFGENIYVLFCLCSFDKKC